MITAIWQYLKWVLLIVILNEIRCIWDADVAVHRMEIYYKYERGKL
jgi:hypothetical protein